MISLLPKDRKSSFLSLIFEGFGFMQRAACDTEVYDIFSII